MREDLLSAISLLSKLVPEGIASQVLRQKVAELGAFVAVEQLQKTAVPKPEKPKKDTRHGAANPAPKRRSGVLIPADLLAWLQTTSPTEVAKALHKQRISVYDWRKSGRCAAEILPQLTALFIAKQNEGARDDNALELEILARSAADGLTVDELYDLAGVSDLNSPHNRAAVRAMLEKI